MIAQCHIRLLERKLLLIRFDLCEDQDSTPNKDLPATIAVKKIPIGGYHSDSTVRILAHVNK